jgi:transposase-like protein
MTGKFQTIREHLPESGRMLLPLRCELVVPGGAFRVGHGVRVGDLLERRKEECRRGTRVVHIFPDTESCLRLVQALCVETYGTWLEDSPYLNMTLLAEQRKELLTLAA